MKTGDSPSRTSYQDYQDLPWVGGMFRPLLISLLAASVVAGPLAVLRALAPWPLGYVLPLALLAAVEGVYSTGQLGRPQWRDRRGVLFRLGELVLLLLALRLASWLFSEGLPTLELAASWLRAPGEFFDDQFILVGGLLLFSWGLAVGMTADFQELAIQPDEVAAQEATGASESRSHQRVFKPTSRADLLGRFMWRWSLGGLLLIFCAALAQTTVALTSKGWVSVAMGSAGVPGDVLAGLVVYFLAGLLLLSEGRLAVLRGQWFNQGIHIMPSVVRNWHAGSLLVLLAVGAVAALLPLGSAGWLAPVFEAILGFIYRLGYFALLLFVLLLSLLLYPLRLLFTGEAGELPPLEPPPLPTQEQVAGSLPDWLGGAIYWVIIGGVLAYLLFTYLGAHGLLRGRWAELAMRLRYWQRARLARVYATVTTVTGRLRARLRPRRPQGAPALRRGIAPEALSPAARVRYFYLNMLEQAAARGTNRPPHKTPLEFGRDLTTAWPDSEVDLEQLTEAFLAARYDHKPIEPDQARAAQSVWQRVIRALRAKSS